MCYIFEKQALRGYQIWYWEVCLGHKLGHVWGMSGAYLGHHLTACLGAVLDVSRATCISDAVSFCRYFVFIFGHRVIGCGYTAIWPPKPQPSQTLSPPVCKHNSLTCWQDPPILMMHFHKILLTKRSQVRQDDVWIITPPKCGTTWTQVSTSLPSPS